MRFYPLFAAFLATITTTSASVSPDSDDYEFIPELAEAVAAMKEQYAAYYNYTGPKKGEHFRPPPAPRPLVSPSTSSSCAFWLENITHQGIAPYASSSNYQVFRNVMDFGAKGDGVTDDTAAIQSAISSGGRCAPGVCQTTTTTPALVYFPYGTYIINTSIIDYYYTQLYGNPNCLPTIRASSAWTPLIANATTQVYYNSTGLIDGDPTYIPTPGPKAKGSQGYVPVNIFWRSIRNLVIDTTGIAPNASVAGIHWPTGQASSINNVYFQMSQASNTQHTGLLIDSGSGGFVSDLVFNGGFYGALLGNQQFTMRNLTFNNIVGSAIQMYYSWSWTFYQLSIYNCSVGFNTTNPKGGTRTGSTTFFDSVITDTPIFIAASYSGDNTVPPLANSLVLENIALKNVPIAVQNNGQTSLAGSSGSSTISGWAQGHYYQPSGPNQYQGSFEAPGRPSNLVLANGNYYSQSKPTYGTLPVSSFLSARSSGAKGDGTTDDTAALQKAINTAAKKKQVLFVDAGDYVVTKTLTIPPGSQIVGEAFSVIISSGKFFNNAKSPKPVVQMGSKAGQAGTIGWSDMIVSTRGQQQGAILFQYNLLSPTSNPSGIWDVHARIGGFTGSNLQYSNCPATPGTTITASNVNASCIAAFLTFYVPPASGGLYMENSWLWTADHDADNNNVPQITVYSGRGLLIESKTGPIWLSGTAVEHHTLYQYQFVNAANVFAGFIQTETPYYQPNPPAPTPWPYNAAYYDPTFPNKTNNAPGYPNIPAAMAWGFRSVNSNSILVYGAGHYSFFNNYSVSCNKQTSGVICQSSLVDFEGSGTNGPIYYNLNTLGSHYMNTINGTFDALWSDNIDTAPSTVNILDTV